MSSKSSKTFYYNIAGEDFTIDDIKHGMLRGNTAKPGHIMRVLNQSDSKTKILPRVSTVRSLPQISRTKEDSSLPTKVELKIHRKFPVFDWI